MKFTKRRPKPRPFQKPPVITIVQKRSKSKAPVFQGTIDYKNIVLLRKFITAEGKILPRRNSRLTAKQQRYIARAVKNARVAGLLPFINKNQPSVA
jgi:small subunit ribosomal protein S18|uniref:Small ribosomal subunit protein bS18c n=1 Tax=Trebouxiophyceae sp. MX-AZ01 TaxID=1208065 RepID=J7KBT8_9CHLO|nr:ribosomal protein S18 [Trebouxiophyceae sp. MX-AZ01]AFQ93828.1 ribosomal protein S18 [Trebouxiophyceae sp. MX-AZ01]